jgi:hypothetical protein
LLDGSQGRCSRKESTRSSNGYFAPRAHQTRSPPTGSILISFPGSISIGNLRLSLVPPAGLSPHARSSLNKSLNPPHFPWPNITTTLHKPFRDTIPDNIIGHAKHTPDRRGRPALASCPCRSQTQGPERWRLDNRCIRLYRGGRWPGRDHRRRSAERDGREDAPPGAGRSVIWHHRWD